MVITEEIIAAYVEGKVTAAERKEVCRYLAVHPEMQDLLLALMDNSDIIETKEKKAIVKPLHAKQSYSDIALASVAFAPRAEVKPQPKKGQRNPIEQRRRRMTDLLDELHED